MKARGPGEVMTKRRFLEKVHFSIMWLAGLWSLRSPLSHAPCVGCMPIELTASHVHCIMQCLQSSIV